MSSRGIAFVVVVLAAIALSGAFELGVFNGGAGGIGVRSTTSCPQCFQTEPILDIVMPVLGNSSSPINPSLTINMTAGSTKSFEVDLYPTFDVMVTMGFTAIPVSTSGGGPQSNASQPSATFLPSNLSLKSNGEGRTYLSLTVPRSAAPGTYSTVISAVDSRNSSNFWGLYFQLRVSTP
jgi:hypothetical protein